MSWDFIWFCILPWVGLMYLALTGLVCIAVAYIIISNKVQAWEIRNQAAVRQMHTRESEKAAAVAYAEQLLHRYSERSDTW